MRPVARRPVAERLRRWLTARAMGIREGDGTAIESIRTGGGTQIAEVRTGDGRVLWSAAPDIPDSAIDYFEDGDVTVGSDSWTGWNDDTGNLTADDQTVLDGQYSGKHSASSEISTISTSRDSEAANDFSFLIRLSQDTGNTADEVYTRFYDGSGTRFGQLSFEDGGGQIGWYNGSSFVEVLPSWSADTTYDIDFAIDYTNNEVDIYVDGTLELENAAFENAASGLGKIDNRNESVGAGVTRDVWIDNLDEGNV